MSRIQSEEKREHQVKEQFLRNVAEHQMDIRLDVEVDGAKYRHVVFSKPGTWNCGFSLTTTPRRLVYAGDMGTFVFERVPDMFCFFRGQRGVEGEREPNFGYWHEKLTACDRPDGSMEKCVEKFRENLEDVLKRHHSERMEEVTDLNDELAELIKDRDDCEEGTPEWCMQAEWVEKKEAEISDLEEEIDEQNTEIKEVIDNLCDTYESEGPQVACREVWDYRVDGKQFFADFGEMSHDQYTWRYLWACYAIPWAIGVYDAAKGTQNASCNGPQRE